MLMVSELEFHCQSILNVKLHWDEQRPSSLKLMMELAKMMLLNAKLSSMNNCLMDVLLLSK